jgi:dolichol kinase
MLAPEFLAIALFAALLAGIKARAKGIYSGAIVSGAIAASATALLLGQSAGLVMLAAGTAVLACLIAVCYITRPLAFSAMLMLAAAVIIACIYYFGDAALVGMFGIGSVCGLLYNGLMKPKRNTRKKMRVETNRDLVQILLGIIVFAALLLLELPYATYAVFAMMIAGYEVNNLFAGRPTTNIYERALAALERSEVTYGIGAVYLAVGTMLVVGFVGHKALMLFGIAALFFADSVATILGMRFGRHRIPYNRNKTVEGSLTFFIILAAVGALLIGIYAVPLSAALALIESLDKGLDDNLRTGIAMALLGIALRL